MNNKRSKLMLTGALAACVACGIAIGIAWATPPQGLTSTPLVGPVLFDEIDSKAETDEWEFELKTKGLSDVFVTHLKIVPGGHGGWHSHPGPSIISVRSGEATFFQADGSSAVFPAGTGFVEDAGDVHILVNEGDVDLETIVLQIVPFGAPRRIDEPAP